MLCQNGDFGGMYRIIHLFLKFFKIFLSNENFYIAIASPSNKNIVYTSLVARHVEFFWLLNFVLHKHFVPCNFEHVDSSENKALITFCPQKIRDKKKTPFK